MSTFINIGNNFLLEYSYSSLNDTTAILNTSEAKLLTGDLTYPDFAIIDNKYTGSRYFFNDIINQVNTNNNINKSVVLIDKLSSKYALLTTDKTGIPFNEYDSKIEETVYSFLNVQGIIYDYVKLHFIQGFDFSDKQQGVFLNFNIVDRNNILINLLSAIYTYQDSWVKFNPTPIIYSGRQYSNYIEFRVPSTQYLKTLPLNTSDNLSHKLTNGVGFPNSTLINIQAGIFTDIKKVDNQFYTTLLSSFETSIQSSDEFNDVSVYINDSTSGDYIELYGMYNNAIFGDYIDSLSQINNTSYTVLHELSVIEQIPNTINNYSFQGYYNPNTNSPDLSNVSYQSNLQNGSYWISLESGISSSLGVLVSKGDLIVYDTNLPTILKFKVYDGSNDIDELANISTFVKTGSLSIIQSDNFDDIQVYRPVLKYGGIDLSFRIEYTLKIINNNTNSQITKMGSYLSFEPNKYGQTLLSISPNSIETFKVYNKKVIKNIETGSSNFNTNNLKNDNIYTKNITSFKLTSDMLISIDTVNVDSDNKVTTKESNIKTISGQGKGFIYISPFDTYLQLNVFELKDNIAISSDLSKVGSVYLNFLNDSGDILKLINIANQSIDISKGQILFKIDAKIYNQIHKNNNKVFYLTCKSGDNSQESIIYTGKYEEYINKVESDIEKEINLYKKSIADLQTIITNQTTVIKTLNANVETVTKNLETIKLQQKTAKNDNFNQYNVVGPSSTQTAGATGATSRRKK